LKSDVVIASPKISKTYVNFFPGIFSQCLEKLIPKMKNKFQLNKKNERFVRNGCRDDSADYSVKSTRHNADRRGFSGF